MVALLAFLIGAGPTLYLPLVHQDTWRLGKGVGMPYPNCQDAQALGVAWLYDWGPFPPTCDGVQSLPMVWTWHESQVCPLLADGDPILLFNEPDQAGQANLTPEQAARYTRFLTNCFPTRSFATPATLSLAWLDEWWAAYMRLYGSPPRVRYLATHCYEWTPQSDYCRTYLTAAQAWAQTHQLAGVLVTEWAVLPCYGQQATALAKAAAWRAWLDAQPGILGYAWFANRIQGDEWWAFQPNSCNTALVNGNGLTAFGRWYR